MMIYRAMRAPLLALTAACALCRPCGAAGEVKTFVSETLSSAGSVLTSPLRMDAGDALWLGGLAAGGLLVYSADGQIRRLASRNHSSLNDDLGSVFEKFGNGGYELGVIGLYGGVSYLAGEKDGPRQAELALEAFAAANAAGTIAKYAAGRARPYAGYGKGHFTPFKFKTFATSSPSGHTTSAFAVASALYAAGAPAAVGIGAYALASGTALQRVYADKHWASDVFTGAALGTAVGRWVGRRDRGAAPSAMLMPVYAQGYSGASLILNF